MDPYIAGSRHIAHSRLYPKNVQLSSYQNVSSRLMPGIFGTVKFPQAVIVPFSSSTSKRQVLSKTLEKDLPSTSPKEVEAANTSHNQELQLDSQVGFGKPEETDDIDNESVKAVDNSVLEAFDNPVFTVKKLKAEKQTNLNEMNEKSVKIKKKKVNYKLKFV
jgi:hypothetical protein